MEHKLAVLEKLLARVQERAAEPRVPASGGAASDLAEAALLDAEEHMGGGPIQLEEINAADELAPDSRTESVPLQDGEEEAPISERRPRSELPVADVTIADLEAEAEPPAAGDLPTMEQMGNTVDLPETDEEVPLELEHPIEEEVAASPAASEEDEEFEISLPRGEFVGGWDESLEAPSTAKEDLERHDRQMQYRGAEYQAAQPSRPPTAPPPPPEGAVMPQTFTRPDVDVAVAVADLQGQLPSATVPFAQLLDASLALGKKG